MSSLFRKPGDSSSSSEASDGQTEDDEISMSQQDSVLSRINTLDSVAAGLPVRPSPPRLDMRQNSAQNVRDLMLHSLLEKEALTEAAEKLGKDRSDPDVQRLGREVYREMARQISNNVDDTYASDEMSAHRATAQEGISRLTRTNLGRFSVFAKGPSQKLVARSKTILTVNNPQHPLPGLDILSGVPVPSELHLHGYPGLQTDRYIREFAELEMVGKGGYGKVFKAKHHLDGSFYAVKRIPVSAAKFAKIQEQGSQELEKMLEEVRSLARFDHANVVRYYNAWLEFTTEKPIAPVPNLLRDNRLLEDVAASSIVPSNTSNLMSHFDNVSLDDPMEKSDHGSGAGIIFGTSDSGVDAEESKGEADSMFLKEKLKKSRRKDRRGSQTSQATMTTISSVKSRMSAVEDANEDEDEEVEVIPRMHMPSSQEPLSEFSESMVSLSDMPGHLIQAPSPGPALMLNVQMSLCETNLATFLSAERCSQQIERHCFHPCFSMELFSNIISGVQYLHAQGVVHRDLKPANVFLSVSSARHAPHGSVDMSSCRLCPKRQSLHLTPRIGDFGLAAALDSKSNTAKPVGTEFYRPQTSSIISEKIDVYALGIVGFELLHHFGTRMERIATLNELRCERFPIDFVTSLGDVSDRIRGLISGMIQLDEQQRLSCDEVRAEVERLVEVLRVSN